MGSHSGFADVEGEISVGQLPNHLPALYYREMSPLLPLHSLLLQLESLETFCLGGGELRLLAEAPLHRATQPESFVGGLGCTSNGHFSRVNRFFPATAPLSAGPPLLTLTSGIEMKPFFCSLLVLGCAYKSFTEILRAGIWEGLGRPVAWLWLL